MEHILKHISFSIILIVVTIELINFSVGENFKLKNVSEKGIIAVFFSTTGLLISRWIYSGYFPLSNLYESLIFLSSSFCIIHMVWKTRNHKNELSAIIEPSTILTQVFATSGLCLSTEMQKSGILLPALQSQWLIFHVSMMLLSYAALLFGSLLSLALVIITCKKEFSLFLNEVFLFIWRKSNIQLTINSPYILYNLKRGKIKEDKDSSENYLKLELLDRLDYWGYRFISLGFIFLTIGILCGGVWANEAWGSYWNWDPKEIWAFITWTIFAIYLHIRTKESWKGKNCAFIASFGFIFIWICYFGVNILGIGLHSYGWFIQYIMHLFK